MQSSMFISLPVSGPGLKRLEVQMTSGFSALTEYWLQCLSVHYSSKLMMQSITCCLRLSIPVERSWQECPVFCEQHVIHGLGACSLYTDDCSLGFAFVYLGDHCLTSCAAFSHSSWYHSDRQNRRNNLLCGGVKSVKLVTQSMTQWEWERKGCMLRISMPADSFFLWGEKKLNTMLIKWLLWLPNPKPSYRN